MMNDFVVDASACGKNRMTSGFEVSKNIRIKMKEKKEKKQTRIFLGVVFSVARIDLDAAFDSKV